MAHDSVAVFGDVRSDSTHVLDRTIARGVTWTAGIKAASVVVSWACTIILARILSPQDYGIVTMATVYVGLTSMVTDFGLGAAIVALPELSERLAAQLHTAASLLGGVAFVFSCLAAVPVSRFFRAPALIPVIIVLSSLLLFDSLRLVPTSRMGRELRFKDLALLDGYRVLVAAAFALPLAFFGAHYWALVITNVAAALSMTVIVLVRFPQRFARPIFAEVKSALRFSSNFLTSQLAWYGYTNADAVVAGRVLGKIALGEYTLAWTIICAPGDKILAIFGRVMPMVLAKVQEDTQALKRYFFLFTEVMTLLIVPATVGLSLVARDFVLIVFGAKWASAVVPLQLLCVFMAIHIIATPTDRLLQATGDARFPARLRFIMLLVLPTAFYLSGRHWGTSGIAAMWVIVYPALLMPMFARVFRKLGITIRDYVNVVAPTLVSTLCMALVVLTLRAFAPTAWSLPIRFTFEVVLGAAAFATAAFSLQRRRLAVLVDFARAIRT